MPSTLNDRSGFDIRDVQLKAFPENILVATWRGQQIGAVIINPHQAGSLPENAWSIFSSGVLPQFRRRGVATLLYDTVEQYLAELGYELWPSPAAGLSEDAYEFWKNRDPAKAEHIREALWERQPFWCRKAPREKLLKEAGRAMET
jgi:ribosomal protein S18 acetylase RimI-like enzyme